MNLKILLPDIIFNMENKKVAILFFGLTRSLDRTIHSIRENILSPLTEKSIDYDIFVHSNVINGPYDNMYSNEHTDNYVHADIEKLLEPKYYIRDNQEDVINSINFEEYYTNLGNWTGMSPEFTRYLIKNMCLALYSKKQITLLFEKHKDEYDYAIIARPDVRFNNKLNTDIFNMLHENNIIIPEKDWFAGCNDRFCVGKPDVVLYYGKLFDDLKEYSERIPIISERYLLHKLQEKNIDIVTTNIDFDIIRI